MQYNIKKEKYKTIAPLLKDKILDKIDILAIQKPYYNKSSHSFYNMAINQFYLI